MERRRTVRSSETLNLSWLHTASFFHYGRDYFVDGEHKKSVDGSSLIVLHQGRGPVTSVLPELL